jgi:uncharacterized protein YfaS (alpha-2-macroglobulin family)
MHRRLFVFNLVWTLVLAALFLSQGKGLVATLADRLDGRGVSAVSLPDPESDRGFLLFFDAPMADEEDRDSPTADSIVRLEPGEPVSARWIGEDVLEVKPLGDLRRATTYRIRLDASLRARDGRRVDTGPDLVFRTPGPRFVHAVAAEEGDLESRDVVLSFDLPIEPKELERSARVEDAVGRPLPFSVEEVAAPGEHAYRFRVDAARGGAGGDALDRITVSLDPGLRSTAGELPLGRPVRAGVVFVEPLVLESVFARAGAVEIWFNRRCPLPDRDLVSVEPAVPFQISRNWRGLRLVGDFPPSTEVTVTLREGFPTRGPLRLSEETERTVTMPDRFPSLGFAHRGGVLSSRARPELEIEGVNVDAYRVSVRSVYANNVVRLAQSHGSARVPVYAPATSREIAVAASRNETFLDRVDLSELLGGDPRGVHLVEIRDLEGRCRPDRRLFQVTDLGVAVRSTDEAVAVHVASLATARPVEGAAIRVLTPTNQLLVAGVTDASGTAVLPFERTGDDRVPYLVAAEKEGDAAWVDLDGFAVELAGEGLGGRPPLREGWEAWVAADRGVIRPGEEIRATAIVRDPEGAAPVGSRIEIRWRDPDGRIRHREEIELPPSGLVLASFPTEGAAATGLWGVEVAPPAEEGKTADAIGQARFLVEAFVPDRIEASLALEEPLRLGRPGTASIEARWLEGGAAAGRPVRLHVRFDHGRFDPPGFEDYSFQGRVEEAPPGARPSISSALDEEGRARIRFPLPDEASGSQILRATLRAVVEDPSGRSVTVGREEAVLRPDFHVGVRADSEANAASVVLVTPEGGLFGEPIPVHLVVERREHEWKRVPRGGSFGYECTVRSEVVAEERRTVEGGAAEIPIRVGSPDYRSWYVVVVRCAERSVEQPIGRVPDRPDRLRVRSLGARIAPGTVADVAVEAPVSGLAFVTLEGRGIHAADVVEIVEGTNEIPIPIPAGVTAPNLHAVVTLRAPQDRPGAAGPFWMVGAASIPLAPPGRSIAVRIEAPPEVEPESEVVVEFEAPGASEAVVALVDVGILRRTDHPDPDPASFFLAPRRLTSRGADTGTSLHEGARFEEDPVPGGGDEAPFARPRLEGTTSRFVETVTLSAGPVPVDAEGRGRAVFRLPPYEGRLRATVTAAGNRAVGGAGEPVVVRAPIGLRLAAPRMVAPGDETSIVVTVRNTTGSDRRIELALDPRAGISLVGTNGGGPASVFLVDGQRESFAVRMVAGGPGVAEIRCTAASGDLRRETSIRFPVRVPSIHRSERIGFVCDGKSELSIEDSWVAETLSVRLVLDSRPDARLLPALRDLIDYPYGCTEQVTSRGFAVLACRALLPEVEGGEDLPDAGAIVRDTVHRVLSCQTPEGGVSMWPSRSAPDRLASLYALDFLVEAAREGFEVPRSSLDALAAWVRRTLHDADDTTFRCWAVDALSRHGTAVGSWASRLSEVASDPEDLLRLALAWARVSEKERSVELLERASRAGSTGEDRGYLRSPLRRLGLELRVRLRADAADPRIPELASILTRALLRPSRLTTQETGQLLLSLATYYRSFGEPGAEEPIPVTVDGATFDVDGSVVRQLEAAPGDRIVVESTGRVYGMLEVSGHRTRVSRASEGGISLDRVIVDAETGEVATGFRKGGVYEVRLEGKASSSLSDLLVTDIVPAGFELERAPGEPSFLGQARFRQPSHVEIRDDRILVFDDGPLEGAFTYAYRMRAVFPGVYRRPWVVAEALYDPGTMAAAGGEETVEIVP